MTTFCLSFWTGVFCRGGGLSRVGDGNDTSESVLLCLTCFRGLGLGVASSGVPPVLVGDVVIVDK
jgi:hypothetical protein